MTDTTAVEREAAELGRNYGTSAGSWVVDGNTSTETLRALLRMLDEGDPAFEVPAPLSGEWADGYTLGRLSDELGVDEGSDEFDDLCSTFEQAYYQAYTDEVERSALASLPEGEQA